MSSQDLTGLGSIFPHRRPNRSGVTDPLIKEARERERRRRRWLALLTVLILGFGFYGISHRSAFGNNATHAPAARPYPSCSLLTNAEIRAVFPKDIAVRLPREGACTWNSLPLGSFASADASVTLTAQEMTKKQFEKGTQHLPQVPGVGTVGFGYPSSNGYDLITAWKNGTAVSVLATGLPSPVAAEKHLAQLALSHA
jgi:hypothetical protein